MTYLISQILLFIILAAVVGFLMGWLIRGHGFKTKLLASENEWGVKYHIQENENERLQAELDELKSQKPSVVPAITGNPAPAVKTAKTITQSSDALPFRSAANRQSQDDIPTMDASDNPLERLRAKLALIEEEEEAMRPLSNSEDNEPQTGEYPDEAKIREKDDLQQINGIDAETEATLNSMGVYRYSQIAHFSSDNIVWIDEYMQFKSQIEENDWVGQARALMEQQSE